MTKTLTADQWGQVIARTNDRQGLLDILVLIEDQKNDLQAAVNRAKVRAYATHVYADRAWFLQTQEEIRALSHQSVRLQRKLGVLRQKDRLATEARHDARSQAKEIFARHFLRVAAELLDRETYRLLLRETDRVIRVGEKIPASTLDVEVDALVEALGVRSPKPFDDTYPAHHFHRVPGNVGDGER